MQLKQLIQMFERRGEYDFADLLKDIDETETRNYSNVEQFERPAITRTDSKILENH